MNLLKKNTAKNNKAQTTLHKRLLENTSHIGDDVSTHTWFDNLIGTKNKKRKLPAFLKGRKTELSVDQARALFQLIDYMFRDELKSYSETKAINREYHIFHAIAKLAPVVGIATASELKFILTEEEFPI